MRETTINRPGALIWRVLAIAAIVSIGDLAVGLFSQGYSLRALSLRFLGTGCLVIVLAIISRRLPWTFAERALAISLAVFTIAKINTTLELFFFSTTPVRELVLHALGGLIEVGVTCSLAAYLFPPLEVRSSIKSDLRGLFLSRGIASWIVRFTLADITYVITYFVFGAIAFHYTRPYYTDPSFGLNLRLPEPGLVLKLQFVRSLIYILISLPLIAGLVLRKWPASLLIGLLLFVAGGLTPLLTVIVWPVPLRFYHTIEILFQNFTTGLIFVWLLGRRRGKGSTIFKDEPQYAST